MFAHLHIISHCVINLFEIVSAQNNTCRIPTWMIIEKIERLCLDEFEVAWRVLITYLGAQCAAVITKISLTRKPPHICPLLFCTDAIYIICFFSAFLPFMIWLPSAESKCAKFKSNTLLHICKKWIKSYHYVQEASKFGRAETRAERAWCMEVGWKIFQGDSWPLYALPCTLSVVCGFWVFFHFLSSQHSFHIYLHRTFESLFMLLELKKLFRWEVKRLQKLPDAFLSELQLN